MSMNRHIGIHKAVHWELAKGHLRACAAVEGQSMAGDGRPDERYEELKDRIESFIAEIEGEGLEE